MAAASMAASHCFLTTRINSLSPPTHSKASSSTNTTSFRASSSPSIKASLSTNFLTPFVGGSVFADFSGHKIRHHSLTSSNSRPKRSVVTMVIPFSRGSAWEQPPPDLASYLYKNRIVYLGMSLVPSVTELILAEFLYLQYEDEEKPIYLYINSTGTTKASFFAAAWKGLKKGKEEERNQQRELNYLVCMMVVLVVGERWLFMGLAVADEVVGPGSGLKEMGGEKLGYETEAFAIYDVMRYVKPPIFTLCVGNAWGEAALLLAAGAKGNRAALPSSTIMMKQPIARFQGQATDVELARKEVTNVKTELVMFWNLYQYIFC
ncbi:ATP-dependent Clp protease proteolytic subunit-related protein 4 chloroplastic [Bienertia sinuspersici]